MSAKLKAIKHELFNAFYGHFAFKFMSYLIHNTNIWHNRALNIVCVGKCSFLQHHVIYQHIVLILPLALETMSMSARIAHKCLKLPALC